MNKKELKPVKYKKSGKLTYLEEQKSVNGRFCVKVLCECGTVKFMDKYYFNSGKAKNCGCIKNMDISDSKTKLYKVWSNMKYRCHNKNSPFYHRYGGRGIKVCEQWLSNFKEFKNWSFNNGYRDGLSLDRIDNNKGYYPENCRWVNQTIQNRNKENNIWLTHEGRTKLLIDWSKELGIEPNILHDRIRAGWTIKEVLTTEVRKSKAGEKIYFNGEGHTISEWAQITGLTQKAISDRLIRGFTIERALTQPLQKRKKGN